MNWRGGTRQPIGKTREFIKLIFPFKTQVLSILTFNRDRTVSILHIYRCHETIWCWQLNCCRKRVHLKMMMLTNSLKLLTLSMSLKVPSFLASKNIPNTIWPGEYFTFMIIPFWINFCISWKTTEYSCSLKAWPGSLCWLGLANNWILAPKTSDKITR